MPPNDRAVAPRFAIRALTILLALPVVAGLAGVVLPAFGYLPALGGDAVSLQPFRDLLAVPGLWTSVLVGLGVGFSATLLSTLAAFLFVAGASGTRVLALASRALGPLLAVPHAAAAFGLAVLVAPSGLLLRLVAGPLGLERPPDVLVPGDPLGLALIGGLVLKEIPFLLLVILAALPQADPERRMRLARSLGYGRLAGFAFAVWPAVYRQIRLPVLAVAAFSSSVVDVAIILGPSRPATLAVRLAGWMGDPDLAWRFTASAGALLQLTTTLAVLVLWRLAEHIGRVWRVRLAEAGLRLRRDAALRLAGLLPALVAGLLAALGLLVLALWSVAGPWAFPSILPESLGLRTWRAALSAVGPPFLSTLLIAALSTAAALVLVMSLLEAVRRSHRGGGPARLGGTVALVLALPLVVPQVSFLFGLQVLALLADVPPGITLVAAVHLVFVAPYVALALADPWFALDPRYERVARSLGRTGPSTLLAIRVGLLLRPLLGAAAIGFAVSVGQYLPTLLIGAGRVPTITTEAVALASGGDRRLVGAMALLQAVLPLLAFAAAAGLPALPAALRRRRSRGMRAP